MRLLILWLLCLCGKFVQIGCRNLFDKSLMPKLLDTDMIELYHLRSFPLLLIESSAGQFSTTTTGLALRSTSTQETIVLQYKPVNYTSCFLPILGIGRGENASIHWDKRAEVVYHNAIDTTYWQQSTFLARINGVVYKNYIRWIEQYVVTNRHFSPQSICSSTNDLSCFTFAESWETFLADSYEAFASFSVRLNAILPPRAIELRYLSFSEPEMVILDKNVQVSAPLTESPSSHPSAVPSQRPSVVSTIAQTATPSSTSSSMTTIINATSFSSDTILDSSSSTNATDSVHRSRSSGDSQRRRRGIRRRGRRLDESVDDPELDRHQRTNHDNTGEALPAQDDALASHMLEDAEQADSEEAAAALQDEQKEGDDVMPLETVAEGDVVEYYRSVMACMEEYQLEDFTNALKSCISETIGYVHVDGDRYYRIKHRYPFIFVYDYLEAIPEPLKSTTQGPDAADLGLMCLFLVVALAGFVASMVKLKLFEYFCGVTYKKGGTPRAGSFSRRRSKTVNLSPNDSFYSKPVTPHPPSPSVVTRLWAAMGGTPSKYEQYATLPTSASEDDNLGDILGDLRRVESGIGRGIEDDLAVQVEGTSSFETVVSDGAPQYVFEEKGDFTHSYDVSDMSPSVRKDSRPNLYRDVESAPERHQSGHLEMVDSRFRSSGPYDLQVEVGRDSPGTSRRRQSGQQ